MPKKRREETNENVILKSGKYQKYYQKSRKNLLNHTKLQKRLNTFLVRHNFRIIIIISTSLEHEFLQNAEFLLFKGVHMYDLSYLKYLFQCTLLAHQTCKITYVQYKLFDSKFTQACT